jgi:hypothetical protein
LAYLWVKNCPICVDLDGIALESSEHSLWRGRFAHLSMMLPSFIYKIAEHPVGKIVLYVIVFAAVFAFIVMYLVHLEGGSL